MDVLDPNVPCDFWGRVFEAQSKHPASKKTDFPVKHEFVSWEYTHHNDGSGLHGPDVEVLPSGAVRIHQKATPPKGLCTTRFHNGFQRRKQSDIRQDEARLQREESKQRLNLIHLERRRQRLGILDKRNGFSLTADSIKCRSTTPFHVQPKTRETGSLSDAAERSEYLLLRDSKYKFHAPAWSGKNHDKRQDLLQREGLNKPKKSTLLGIGGADLASAGANDMFSKAIYDPAKACAVEGLVETCIPGRYTPRKVAADRETVKTLAAPEALQYDGESRGGVVGGLRAASPTSLGTVFRVVPNGLGKHSVLAGRGGLAVSGIAPSKRLCGSRSAPIIESHGSKADPHLVQASSPGGDVSARSAQSRRRSGSLFSERLHAVTGRAMTMESERDGDRGSALGGSRASSRGLARSKSDCGSCGRRDGREKCGTEGEEVGLFTKSRSASSAQPSPAKSAAGSPSLGSSRTRGASPAQRRNDDQLALDLAAVRSL